jgi:hypothetical protein
MQTENVKIESESAVVRDMDLVRTLMIAIEQDPELDGSCEINDYGTERLGVGSYSIEQVAYHLDLLISAGMVDGVVNGAGYPPTIRHLTWEGHNFVESMKNVTVWGKAKTIVMEKGGGMTVALLAALLEKLLKQHFGLE